MPVLQVLALAISLPIAAVGIVLFVRAIRQIIATLKIGQPTRRTDQLPARTVTLVRETLGHTRMLQWSWVGAGHWFVMTGFGLLFFTLVTAFGQLFSPSFHIPFLGTFFLFEWATELFTWVMLVAIVSFIVYRLNRPTERVRGPRGRFFGSTMWQGYFVELVILGVGVCIVLLRGLEYAYATHHDPDYASAFHFPLTFWLGEAFSGLSQTTLANLIWVVATLKIVISFAWMITISLQPTMGVAWHRFLAFFNIFFKRHATGRTALGGLAPMTSGGKPVDFEDLEGMDEDTKLGVGAVEDFSWKGILDFTTCTECGRCQSQCPAWNTDKPLSPKMLVLQLRDHAHAKAPYLLAESEEARTELPAEVLAEAERPLVGATEGWAWEPSGGAVIDDDVLWSCTSCGACVQQCPVDIEHVDHIVDMRRYQVLIESNFPTELGGLFKGLENKGNPWNMSPQARLDWAKDLPFEVKVVGEDVESLDEVEWLFWVGCAGAYEDRAKKTTRAVAELLDMAGVDFAVLGNGETCTGDPARRAGNEFVFQGLATQNAEVLKETKAKKVVSTCAHCFNTLKNEYAAFGVELEVVHHTQLLNRLVREKRLTPVATNGGPKRSVTYHDPCYIGRHNGVYSPPRELLDVIPDAELTEMPRNSERSFCCGAGGARMWMEENIGERINLNRTQEAIDTGADQIAVGCPFCRVMLSDGLTMKQSEGSAREEVEVLDVAQMLLASVKGETKAPAAAAAPAAPSARSTATPAAADPDATKAEPSPGDATQGANTVTDTEDVGPLAKASGGSSLFDDGGDAAADTGTAASSGSLFDTDDDTDTSASGGSLFDTDGDTDADTAKPAASGGSLFDVGDDADADADGETDSSEASEEPTASGGSLFDLGEEEPAATSAPRPEAEAADSAAPARTSTSTPSSEIPEGGSLFDLGDESPEDAGESDAAEEPRTSDTGAGVDRSQDAADTDVAPTEDQTQAEAQAEAQATSTASTTTSSTTLSTPATEIPDGGSLFDIEAETTDNAAEAQSPAPTQEPQVSDTGEGVDRSQDAADTDVAPTADQADAGSGTRTVSTPATEIPEGGSLFDLEADETETAAPAATTSAVPAEEQAGEPQVSDTGEGVDRSQDAADTDVAPTEDQADPEAEAEAEPATEPETEPVASQAPTGTRTVSTPATEIPEGGSLFDLDADETETAAPAATTSAVPADQPTEQPADEPQVSDTGEGVDRSQDAADTDVAPTADQADPETEPETEPQAGSTAGSADPADKPIRSLKDIKAQFAGGAGSTSSTTEAPAAEPEPEAMQPEPEPEPEQDAESEPDEAPADNAPSDAAPRRTSGEAHQPRTDTDIDASGSLFDL